MPSPQVATICGTMKLFPQMLTVADELTRQGYIVLMPFVRKQFHNSESAQYRIRKAGELAGVVYDPQGTHINSTMITDEQLDAMHLKKIDMSDLVVFVTDYPQYIWGLAGNRDSSKLYFGESTTSEKKYTEKLGTPFKIAQVTRADYRDTINWIEPRDED